MAGKAKKAGAPKKKANGYKMPPPIPQGEVIHDIIGKRKWRIGPSIGIGGFGEIYSACDDATSPKKGGSYPYVIKIEPHENGPLFVEKHFYVRNANKDDIANFMKSKKLSSLGMPAFYGSGSHEFQGEKYRYLVLERYGKDIWKMFKEANRSFPAPAVFQLGLQMLDVLEYIHNRGYVHGDLKGANILMGLKKGTENQAYLVDFGLALRITEKDFKPDPKSAHDGTIEYTSRDAHLGAPTMRGDLEILAYNLLQWLVGELPWEKYLTQPKKVQAMKEDFMQNVRKRISTDYPDVPNALIKFFEYINTLKPRDLPDYTKCRQIFESYLKSVGKTRSSKLDFATSNKSKSKTKPKVASEETESDDDISLKKVKEDKDALKPKRGRPIKVKRGRKPKPKSLESDDENEIPDDNQKVVKTKKRKSSEPTLVVKIKKTKMTPKATPPAKKNHTNISTQTSIDRIGKRESRKSNTQVKFDSPITANTENQSENIVVSINSSGDIFDDSFEIKKLKPKRKLLADEEFIQTKVVRKKVTTVKKGTSWRDTPAIANGKSPPK